MKFNKYVIINNEENYYDNIYKYLYSKKCNTNNNGKTDWKKVIYPPNLYKQDDPKTTKDKKRQNFRLIAEKHALSEDNILYAKKLNKENKIIFYKVPYEGEKLLILHKYHDKKGHINIKRVYNEIIVDKIYWKSIRNVCLNYIKKCPICIRQKSGIIINPKPGTILIKGPKERYVIDGWKIHTSLAVMTDYSWVIGIIDYFSKYMKSYPVKNNDAIKALNCIKQFCLMMGYPKILQTHNGAEYKNSLLNEFCLSKNILHIFSSPYRPQSNGIVEVSHKEIRKNVMIYYGENPNNFDLNNAILNPIYIHNNNIHMVTNYKPIN